MPGAEAVAALLPRLAALPTRDDLDSYRLTPERAADVRRRLSDALLDAVPLALLFPARAAPTVDAARALLARSGHRLSHAQRAADALASSAEGEVPALPEYSTLRRGMACGHVFRKGEPIFRCHDCSYDDTCVQCSTCFEHSIHAEEQHDIVFSVADESGACCDCGDVEAWKCDLRCDFHSEHPRGAARADDAARAPATLDGLYAAAPAPARDALLPFAAQLLAFVLEVLGAAEQRRAPALGPELVEELKRMPSFERVFAPAPAGEAPPPFAALLWNDERHSFNEVSDRLLEVKPGMSVQGARAFAERVDQHGREVLALLPELRRLVIMARRINIHGLLVTVLPAFDVFVQEVAGEVLAFLVDLARCAVYTPDGAADARAVKVVLAQLLLAPWALDAADAAASPAIARALFDPAHVCRLDALLLLDAKMWKAARLDVRALVMDVIACREAKQALAVRFAYVYPRLIETFILHDREPEHSIYHITVQLFSVPSVAADLVLAHGFLDTLRAILQALFASDYDGRLTHLTLPPPPPARGQADPGAALLSQSKCYRVFYDTRYLVAPHDVQVRIAADVPRFLGPWLAFFALFHGIGPDTRAAHAHVEFESEVWHQLFLLSSHLAHLAKLLGEAAQHAAPGERAAGLAFVAQAMLAHMAELEARDPATHVPARVHTVAFPTDAACATAPVAAFGVAHEPVSFHHPMHWLLAELCKSLGAADGVAPPIAEHAMLALLEHPLRVVVKLAQIRCNVWVRNGYGIRLQAFHYRDSMWMRDIMYDQDVFLVQCALAFAPADRVLLTLLDRFDLLAYFSGATEAHAVYDAEQTTFVAEELVLLLVVLLSEIGAAAHWPIERQVRRELVHYLALGAGTYSEVTKQIPERYTDHGSLDRELARVATFRTPDGTHDLGMYELRPECYAEVGPYFHHYSRNQRERADEVLAARRAQGHTDVPLLPPRQLDTLAGTPFARLVDAFAEPVLLQIVAAALAHAAYGRADAVPETLLRAALQLVLLGLVEAGAPFAARLVATPVHVPHAPDGAASVHALLVALAHAPHVAAVHAHVRAALDTAAGLDAAAAAAWAPAAAAAATDVRGDGEAKRAAARARQAAIMQQFSAQQQSLLATLEDELEEEDEAQADAPDYGTCILCQERLDAQRAFGTLVHLQESRVVRTTPPREHAALGEVWATPLDLDRGHADGTRVVGTLSRTLPAPAGQRARIALGYPAAHHTTGVVAVTCGHSMHVACFHTYLHSTEQRHALQVARNHPEDLSRLEYVCPLCKGLGNTLLPVPGAAGGGAPLGAVAFDDQPLTEWVRRINIAILKNTSASASARAEHQEHERGSGCFLPFFVPPSAAPSAAEPPVPGVRAGEAEMLQRTRAVLQLLAHDTRAARARDRRATVLEGAADGAHADALYVPEHVVGYTLAQLEIVQRGTTPPGTHVGTALSEQQVQLVRALLDALASLARGATHGDAKGTDALRQGLLKRLLPHWAGEHVVRSPLLLRNALGVLVEAAVLMPEHVLHVAALLYYVVLVQTVFGLAQPAFAQGERRRAADDAPVGAAEALALFPHARWLVTSIVNLVGYVRGNITLGFDHCSDADLAKLLCAYTLPFLRRAALLVHVVAGDVPAELPRDASEYRRLLALLRIPPPAEALPMHAAPAGLVAMLVEGWTKHAYVHLVPLFRPLPILHDADEARAAVPSLVLEHPHIYELLPLPHDLAALLQQTQTRTCARCHTLPPLSSLCLLCGELLCDQSYCCSDLEDEGRGECHQHMEHCGGRLGAHFRVGSNMVVLLFGRNGCFTSSPYLNTHGEVDHALLKARPLRLHRQRYDELRRQYLTHGIANMVTRRTEANVGIGGWTTL
ncbi:RING-type E3 ubiquitin transferase [Malassezia brasiliensis]|uniref:E3 ubiquitin-protein ligase n=1 Tax=Malassezia brasiliensis TaxID=1821822 RepID=A0AAF0DV58_9BASI|nr:RING-type E3 ubiquitin transferase [Malassezia brasiliensis]